MAVVIEAMRTYFFQRAAAVYFAVAGQIEMIADVTEAAGRWDVGRGGNPQSPGPRLEAWLSNEQ